MLGRGRFLCIIPLFIKSFFNFVFLIYIWLHWVFVAVRGLSLVEVSGGYSLVEEHRLLRHTGFRL